VRCNLGSSFQPIYQNDYIVIGKGLRGEKAVSEKGEWPTRYPRKSQKKGRMNSYRQMATGKSEGEKEKGKGKDLFP